MCDFVIAINVFVITKWSLASYLRAPHGGRGSAGASCGQSADCLLTEEPLRPVDYLYLSPTWTLAGQTNHMSQLHNTDILHHSIEI